MKQIIVSLLFAILLLGCHEETVIFKLIKSSWTSHPSFMLNNKVKFNSYSTGKSLLLHGPGYFSVLSKDGLVRHYVTYFDYPFGKKLPINESFFLSSVPNDSFIGFWPVAQPDFSAASVYFDMKNYDEYFIKTNFELSAGKENMSINNGSQCLVPYYSNHPDNRICLFLFDIGKLTAPYLYLKKGQRITINESVNTSGNVSYIKPIDDFFIVSTGAKIYKIHSNGTVKQLLTYRIDEAFKWTGEIYLLSKTSQIAKSSDGGATWDEFAGMPASLATGTYYVLGDSLVMNYSDAIFSAKFKLPKYSLRELKNDGVAGNLITSVSEFNDSIYVTTYSGVFYKSRREFYNSKLN